MLGRGKGARGAARPRGWPAALALRAAALAALWWAFTEGRPGNVAAGATIATLAVAASAAVAGPAGVRVQPLAAVRLAGWFLWRSLLAGADVAWRALAPGPPVAPGYRQVALALPEGAGRMLVVAATSLMPGTLSVRLRGGTLTVHALDARGPIEEQVRSLERRVAAALGLAAVPAGGGGG